MRAITVGWLLLMLVSVGCAEGFGAEVVVEQALGEKPDEGNGATKTKDAGSDKGSTGNAMEKVPCAMGDVSDCSCDTPGSMGMQYCMFDATSPTKGSFSECLDCVDPPPPQVDSGTVPGDVSLIDGGVGMGSGGVGGSGGSGGSGSGGTGGTSTTTGGTTATAPRPKIPCPSLCVQPCIPFGILACCRDNGTCGCSWAPGAYCL